MSALAKKPAAPKLFDRIGNYFDSRHQNGVDGLVLLDECIRRTASAHRDWDALARFVSRANMSGSAAKVKKIVRAAFGNSLVFTTDKKHPAGGRFEMKWEGAFPLAGSNTYGYVKKAIVDNKSWDDADLQKKISEIIPDLPKKDKSVDAAAQTAKAKVIVRSLLAAKEDGFEVAALMREIETLLIQAKKPSEVMDKAVVNGVTVYTPKF